MNQLLITLLLLLSGFLIPEKAYSQLNTVDPAFNPNDNGFGNGDGLNSAVGALSIQSDGRILMAGQFTSYNGTSINKIARLSIDGQLDVAFDPGNAIGSNPNGAQCMALQSDGKIIVGGYFGFTRLNADGSEDLTFNPPALSPSCCAIQPDGKILIGEMNSIRRLNTDGSLDTTFHTGTGPNGNVYSIQVQSDGKILMAGVFSNYNMVNRQRIARLNSDGTLDLTFNTVPGANDVIKSMAIQTDGKVVIAGYFTSYAGNSRLRIARLNSDGTLDMTFNPGTGANSYSNAVSIQSDGKILIGGAFTTYNGISRNRIARLNLDGSLDNTFNPGTGANFNILDIDFQSDESLVVGGSFTFFNESPKQYLVILNSDGTLRDTFNQVTGSNNTIYSLSRQLDGKILIGGSFTNYNGASRNRIARMNDVADLDTTFNPGSGVDSIVHSIVLQFDGKIIIGGSFTNYNGVSRNRIARLNEDGNLDLTFDPGTGANGTIYSASVQSDGKILIAGAFTTYNGFSRNRIARLNADGSLDFTFNPTSGLNNTAYDVVIQSDGKIIVGGSFTSYNGTLRPRIARLNGDGSLDLTFITGNGFNATVYEIAIQPDGKIILGGDFTTYAGTSRNKVARLNDTGSLDVAFNPGTGPNGTVYALRLYSDGKILINGSFTTSGGLSRNRITRLHDNGSLDVSFNPGTGADNTIYCNWIQPDDRIIIAGAFTSYNGIGRNRIARLFNCLPTNTNINQTVCSSYTLNNITYTSSGSYTQTLINSTGCDSIINLNLTVNGTTIIVSLTECNSYQWTNGVTYTSSGVYNQALTNIAGCDSILTLNLTITNPTTGTDVQTACDSLTWIDGNTYYSSINTPTFVLQNTAGCDSIVNLDLTITNSYSWIDIQTSCDSLVWIDGNTYSSSTNTPTFVLQNAAGCDSIITLNLTITNSNTGIDVQTACDSLTWLDGNIYTSSTNTPTFVLQNVAGCDSTVTLDLTIIPALPLVIANSFSMPSNANSCTGEVAVTVSGNADFELDFDNGSQVITSGGYSLVTNLCPGTHDLHVTDNCGDTLSTTIVIPVDSNFVFNNPFIDSLAQDSLGVTLTNCDIYYAGIDTAYIDSIWANGNTVNVIWNIVDSNGSNFDTTSYVLNNGNGVYWLQLSVFCPNKSVGEYFTVTEAIYFNNGSVSTAGLPGIGKDLFAIYPNPTNDLVHISFSGSDAELTVYDVQGKVVLKDRIQNNGIVSLQSFERGVYLFDFNNSQGHSVQRVVKQ